MKRTMKQKKAVIATILSFLTMLSSCSITSTKPQQQVKPQNPIPNCVYSVVTYGQAIECMILQHKALKSLEPNNENEK